MQGLYKHGPVQNAQVSYFVNSYENRLDNWYQMLYNNLCRMKMFILTDSQVSTVLDLIQRTPVTHYCCTRPQDYKTFSLSTQLRMKFQLAAHKKLKCWKLKYSVSIILTNAKMPTIVDYLSVIWMINVMLSWVEHEKGLYFRDQELRQATFITYAFTILNAKPGFQFWSVCYCAREGERLKIRTNMEYSKTV